MYAMFINILLMNKIELPAKQNIFINKMFKLNVRNFGLSQSEGSLNTTIHFIGQSLKQVSTAGEMACNTFSPISFTVWELISMRINSTFKNFFLSFIGNCNNCTINPFLYWLLRTLSHPTPYVKQLPLLQSLLKIVIAVHQPKYNKGNNRFHSK